MLRQLGRFIFGRSIESNKLYDEKLSVIWGMPLLSSDAISSVAYAVEEMMLVLIPVIGLGSFIWMPRVALAIILLLLILTFSYRNLVNAYPNGGGSYVVAKENLHPLMGLIAGSSLIVDYTLTVAVSISAASAAIISAWPMIGQHRIIIAIVLIILLAVFNLRGLKESSRIFSILTYLFILSIIVLIFTGIAKNLLGYPPFINTQINAASIPLGTQAISVFLLMRAFASGCSAVTGIESISNAVPNFREPSAHNARIVYLLLAVSIIICFGGVTLLSQIYHPVPNHSQTLMAQITLAVFGYGPMFYIIQATTAIILAMAANTSFAGFPTLLSVIAQDGYAPRQLAMRGHRLNFNNGIVILTILALIFTLIFKADTHSLIALYAVGVFISFTLSQSGMVAHWFRLKPPGWQYKALINSLGLLVTLTTIIVIGATKFTAGAWIVFVLIAIIVLTLLRVKKHYLLVAEQLDIPNERLPCLEMNLPVSHHIIMPIDSLNAMTIKALRYARSMTPNVEAFHVETVEGRSDKLRSKWALLKTDIPLIVKFSPYREIVHTLTDYIYSEEHASRPGDIITVLLPQFVVSRRWQLALHNNTSLLIANAMLHKHNVIVSILPFYLDDYISQKNTIKWSFPE